VQDYADYRTKAVPVQQQLREIAALELSIHQSVHELQKMPDNLSLEYIANAPAQSAALKMRIAESESKKAELLKNQAVKAGYDAAKECEKDFSIFFCLAGMVGIVYIMATLDD